MLGLIGYLLEPAKPILVYPENYAAVVGFKPKFD
jgi:hypothetical protein